MRTILTVALVSLMFGCGGGVGSGDPYRYASRALGSPDAGGGFGESVSLGGGGVAIGSPTADRPERDAGAVHLYDAGSGLLQRTLFSPEAEVAGGFGRALDGDATHLLVGAPGEGRAYLVERASGRVVFTLRPDAGEPEFGRAVALDGDELWVASRYSVLLFDRRNGSLVRRIGSAGVEAMAADGGRVLLAMPASGAAELHDGDLRRVFARPGLRSIALDGDRVALAARATVAGFDAVTGDRLFERSGPDGYGSALGFAGRHLLIAWKNVLGEAQLDLVDWTTGLVERTLAPADAAAAISVDGGIALLGIAQRSLAQTVNCDSGEFLRLFESPAGATGGHFGNAVIALGSGFAVGAPDEAGGDGRVHVLNADGSLARTLAPPAAGGQGEFGFALLDFGGDLVVGAPGDVNSEGRVYRIDPSSGSVLATYVSPSPQAGGQFGFALADNGGNLVVGAPGEGATTNPPGLVHRFDAQDSFDQTFSNPSQAADGLFGHAVAANANEILVGAPNAPIQSNSSGDRTGMAFVFDPTQREIRYQFESGTPEVGGRFGAAVALEPTFYFVGAPVEDNGNTLDTGKVHRFDRQQGGLDGTILSPNGATGGEYGFALHIDGGRLAIGAPGEPATPEGGLQVTDGFPQSVAGPGVVHVIDLATGYRDQRYENADRTPEPGRFGASAHLAGTALYVGAPLESASVGAGAGRAYVFAVERRTVVISPNVEDSGTFGRGVATFDAGRILVNAPFELRGGGRVYLYDAASGGFDLTLVDPVGEVSNFGLAIVAWNGAIAVGAPVANSGAGAVYVFDTQGSLIRTLNPNGAGGFFGGSLAVDAAGNLVVGAMLENNSEGAVYRFDATGALVDVLDNGAVAEQGEFGRSVFALGNDIGVEAPTENNDEGRFYVFDASGNLKFTLTSPTPQANALFGFGAALFNGLLHVGDPVSTQFGAIHVFDPADGSFVRTISSPLGFETAGFGYTLQPLGSNLAVASIVAFGGRVAVLDASDELVDLIYTGNPKTTGGFGFSMADLGGTLVIGSPLEDVNPTAAGRVYLAQVSQQQAPPADGADLVVTSPSPTAGGSFGLSVGFAGANSVIGAPLEDGSEGVVHVLANDTGGLVRTLRSPNAAEGGAFGGALDGNSVMTVVGAPAEITGQDRTGRAYLFDSGTGALSLTFESGNPKDGGLFGVSIAVADLNLVVGAPGEDVGTLAVAGRAYYFDCQVEEILTEFQSPNPESDGSFGFAVAARDFEVFIGAPGENGGEGAVYWFNGLTGALLGTFASPNAQTDGLFGGSLAVDGNRLVVGAPNEIDPQGDEFERGRVHVFDLVTGQLERSLQSPASVDGAVFGAAVAIAGGTIYAGAPGEGQGAGAVYAFDATDGGLLDGYVSPNAETDGFFGFSLAANGGNLLVGAPQEDGGAADAGRAYLNPDPASPQ